MLRVHSATRWLLGVLVAVSTAFAGAAIGAPPAAAATPRPVTVDDDVTSGAARFTWTGSWRDQGWYHYSSVGGSTVTLRFTGTKAALVGVRSPAGGTATVSVDGRTVATIGFWARHRTTTTVFTTATLRDGRHTVTLTVPGRSGRVTPGRRVVAVDRALVWRPASGGGQQPGGQQPAGQPTPPPPVIPPPSGGGGPGVVSFTFDDGQLGQYQNARPALDAAGFRGTFYVISDALGWGGSSMNASQVRDLADAGHEVGDHTRDHANLTGLSADQVASEFATSKQVLENASGHAVTTCAYPYGATNASVQEVAARYFTGCRGTGIGQNPTGSAARYDLTVLYVHTGTSAADVRAAADRARADGTWLILVYHGVGSIGSAEDVSAATFSSHVDAVKASGVTVRTVAGELAAIG